MINHSQLKLSTVLDLIFPVGKPQQGYLSPRSLLVDCEIRIYFYQSWPDEIFLLGRDPMGEKSPVRAVQQNFGSRKGLEIEVPGRMHVVAAKGCHNDQIGSVLELEDRDGSRAPCSAALRPEQHERSFSDPVGELPAG